MRVISIVNQKGGVGKSTITINLARAIQRDDASVAVIDCDPQGTTTDWAALNKKHGEFFPVHHYHIKDLPHRLSEFNQYDVVLIDGAPRLEELSVAIIKVSDVILMPVTPSPNDVWASLSFVDLVKERMKVKPDLRAAFIVNRQKPNTNAINEVRNALSNIEIPVLDNGINDRIAYAKTLGLGVTVFEDKGNASSDIIKIKNEILNRVINNEQTS
ncbi:MAG: ParA family partition ATPase [Neisseriaceae bacterium]|jgi:chromosome partitioning protein